MISNSKPILLVEDNNADASKVRQTFKELKFTNSLISKISGREAIAYLKSEDNGKPCVILLDLNTPGINSAEFLKTTQADEMTKDIPVVVMASSEEEYDKIDSFKSSVAGCIVKPVDCEKFVEAIRMVDLYWELSEQP